MNMMKKKLGKTGGFTLVEMLIVVAIIAILIAVSIPLVSQALEKARDATDQANERAAKAEAVMVFMGVTDVDFEVDTTGGKYGSYYYNATAGSLIKKGTSTTAPKGYGKCTQDDHDSGTFAAVTEHGTTSAQTDASKADTGKHTGYGSGTTTDGVLEVYIFTDGTVDMVWVAGT